MELIRSSRPRAAHFIFTHCHHSVAQFGVYYQSSVRLSWNLQNKGLNPTFEPMQRQWGLKIILEKRCNNKRFILILFYFFNPEFKYSLLLYRTLLYEWLLMNIFCSSFFVIISLWDSGKLFQKTQLLALLSFWTVFNFFRNFLNELLFSGEWYFFFCNYYKTVVFFHLLIRGIKSCLNI